MGSRWSRKSRVAMRPFGVTIFECEPKANIHFVQVSQCAMKDEDQNVQEQAERAYHALNY